MKYVLVLYALMSIVTFIAYGFDKRAAVRGRRRIAERTLHLLELLGGFPGALVGQQVFRHKRRKWQFLVVFWLIVVVHAVGWFLWWRYRG
jgi:uncharacterized membrane protein YsdA (DUF1294 family)